MKQYKKIDSLLINSTIEDENSITYEFKLLNPNLEEIRITYLKNESRYTDDGYTIYSLSLLQHKNGKIGVSQTEYNNLSKIAKKFGVSLATSELTILRDDDKPDAKHAELANLINCIISINALARFTDIFE